MIIPDLFGSSQAPGVRRPKFAISFGAGGGGGGPTDLLSSAAAAIGLGGGGAEDPWQRSVASVAVEIGLAPEVDVAEIVLAADSQAPAFAIGDEGTIELGYEDEDVTAVYAGRIESIARSTRGPQRITIANATSSLAALRIEQSFEDQAAGDVVEELASRASVTTGNIVAGPDLAFIVLFGGSNGWEHVARLARVSGHHGRITADNKLDFAPVSEAAPMQTFTFGVDVLSIEQRESAASFDSVSVYGEGAAGSQGKDAWNWLIKQPSPVTGAAGQGARARAFADRALRTAQAVRGAAQALADAAARAATTGTLLVPGAPKVVPGARIEIAGSRDGAFDGAHLVTRVRHVYSKRGGFRSRISFAGADGGGGNGGLLGGLL